MKKPPTKDSETAALKLIGGFMARLTRWTAGASSFDVSVGLGRDGGQTPPSADSGLIGMTVDCVKTVYETMSRISYHFFRANSPRARRSLEGNASARGDQRARIADHAADAHLAARSHRRAMQPWCPARPSSGRRRRATEVAIHRGPGSCDTPRHAPRQYSSAALGRSETPGSRGPRRPCPVPGRQRRR